MKKLNQSLICLLLVMVMTLSLFAAHSRRQMPTLLPPISRHRMFPLKRRLPRIPIATPCISGSGVQLPISRSTSKACFANGIMSLRTSMN